ncbi:MAG: WD40 repeat domain-containing protein [Limisphaerales bacterium]
MDWWLRNRSASRLLIVWTDGGLVWDGARADFDWSQTTALPRRLQGAFPQEPLHLDLRWARTASDLSLRRPGFADAIGRLSATLRGLSLDELIGEDVKQHRRTMALLRLAMATPVGVTATAVLAALLAVKANRVVAPLATNERDRAALQAHAAKSRQLAAVALNQQAADTHLAILLAAKAVDIHQTAEAESALRQTLAASLEPTIVLDARQRSGYAVFSPDGIKVLARSDSDANPQIFEAATGKVLSELVGHTQGGVIHACFSKDGRRTATTGGDGLVRLWDSSSGRSLCELHHPGASAALLGPDDARVLTLAVGGDAMLWNSTTGMKVAEIEYSSNIIIEDKVRDASFHPDGSRIALCQGHWTVVLDAKTGKILMKLKGHTKGISNFAYSPDGNWLVTAGADRSARLWRSATGLCETVFVHDAELHEARFSPDGKWIVVRDSEKLLLVLEAGRGRKVAQIEILLRPAQPVILEFSPNGKCLLAASLDSDTVGLWETATGVRLGELVGQGGAIRTLNFSADGRRAVVGSMLAPARVYATDICASATDLLALAERRAARQPTAKERQKYLGTP